MTNQRDLKRIIRARMAATGETYTQARASVLCEKVRLFGVSPQLAVPPNTRLTPRRPPATHHPSAILIREDRRHELMCIVARLAGHVPCCAFRKTPYAARVDQYFAPFRGHPAVVCLERLKQTRGLDYWFFLQYYIKLTDIEFFESRLPFEAPFWAPEAQWTLAELDELTVLLRDFVRDTNAIRFLNDNAPLYSEALQRLQKAVDVEKIGRFLHDFHNLKGRLYLYLSPSFLTRSQDYIGQSDFPDGRLEYYGFIESNQGIDEQGIPTYADLELPIVELYCRLRINAEVSIHENILRNGALDVFAALQPQVKRFPKYFHPTMARAIRCAILGYYLSQNDGPEAVERFLSELPFESELLWIRPLSDLFREFGQDRVRYPDLGAFMPRVAEFFSQFNLGTLAAQMKTRPVDIRLDETNAPQIKRLTPAMDDIEVDPDLDRIQIEFDRPMNGSHWSILPLAGGRFPILSEDRGFDETKTVLSLPVRLEPETRYALRLNSEHYVGFADEDGHGLIPVVYEFRTKSRETSVAKDVS